MRLLLRALAAERIKLRHTLALWMCLIAPGVVVGLQVLQLLVQDLSGREVQGGAEAWQFFIQSSLALWALLMLPLYLTLQSALLAGLEHADRQWKHLLALPLPRWVHYLSKLLTLTAMLAAALLILAGLILIGGAVLMWAKPEVGISGAPPLAFLFAKLSLIFVSALAMVAIHTLIAIRWSSFTVAVASGMSATVMGFLIGQSARFSHWYPWSMTIQTLAKEPKHLSFVLIASTVIAIALTAYALWDFSRREFG